MGAERNCAEAKGGLQWGRPLPALPALGLQAAHQLRWQRRPERRHLLQPLRSCLPSAWPRPSTSRGQGGEGSLSLIPGQRAEEPRAGGVSSAGRATWEGPSVQLHQEESIYFLALQPKGWRGRCLHGEPSWEGSYPEGARKCLTAIMTNCHTLGGWPPQKWILA